MKAQSWGCLLLPSWRVPICPLAVAGQRAEHQPRPGHARCCWAASVPGERLQGSGSFPSRLQCDGSCSSSSGRSRALNRSVSVPHPPPEEGSGSASRWLWGQPGCAALELPLQREVPLSVCSPSMWELPLPPPPPPANRCRPAEGLSRACQEGGESYA